MTTTVATCMVSNVIPIAVGGRNLPVNAEDKATFLDVNDLVNELCNIDQQPLQFIPRGIKENQFFIVDNSHNVQRRKEGLRSQFWDDCGAWMSGGPSCRTIFLSEPGQRLKKVVLKDGLYCFQRQRDKKPVFIPLETQPNPESLLFVHRYYTKLKTCHRYEKRVTWIMSEEPNVCQLACYEYRGSFTCTADDMTTKKGYYKQTRWATDQIKQQIKSSRPNDISTDMLNASDSVADGLRLDKQVDDIKYRQRKERTSGTCTNYTNLADCMQHVENPTIHIQSANVIPLAVGGRDLPFDFADKGMFLDVDYLVNELCNIDQNPLQFIPRGLKENKFFIVDNSHNIMRRKEGLRSQFWDDCGAWLSGGVSNKSIFVSVSGQRLKKVVLKDGLYCFERQRGKKPIFIPLATQPDPDSLLFVHRYYTKLKACPQYEKRVSWIMNEGPNMCQLACYEYRGSFACMTGDVTTKKRNYKRTRPDMINCIKQQIKSAKPNDVYSDLLNDSEMCDCTCVVDGQRLRKQVHDTKYRERKKEAASDTCSDYGNLDDHAQDEENPTTHIPSSMIIQLHVAVGGRDLPVSPNDKVTFLDVNDLVSELCNINQQLLQCIPRGLKENKFFIVDNTNNIQRRKVGLQSQFCDDCGAWMLGGSSNITVFVSEPGQRLKKVVLKDGLYCFERQRNKKTVFIPLDTQPDPESLLFLHRYYAKLKACRQYEKRVSWIMSEGRSVNQLHVACYEYRGTFPCAIDDSSDKTKGNNKRTRPDTINRIKRQIKSSQPNNISTDLNVIKESNTSSVVNGQVQEMKYRERNALTPLARDNGKLTDCLQNDEGLTTHIQVSNQSSTQDNMQTVILCTNEKMLKVFVQLQPKIEPSQDLPSQ